MFQTRTHIITKTANHDSKVVYNKLNFLDKIKTIVANKNPQIIQVILLAIPVGNIRSKFW